MGLATLSVWTGIGSREQTDKKTAWPFCILTAGKTAVVVLDKNLTFGANAGRFVESLQEQRREPGPGGACSGAKRRAYQRKAKQS